MTIHERLGPALIALGVVGLLWGLAGVRRGDPGGTLRTYVILVAALAGVEALIGLVLLATGHRPAESLHYVYAVAVVATIPLARRYAAAQSRRGEAVAITVGCLVLVLLGVRAVMTGGS